MLKKLDKIEPSEDRQREDGASRDAKKAAPRKGTRKKAAT